MKTVTIKAKIGKREIQHSVHGSCSWCLLGSTVAKYLRPGYAVSINAEEVGESEDWSYINSNKGYAIYTAPSGKIDASSMNLLSARFAEEATALADNWERDMSFGRVPKTEGDCASKAKSVKFDQLSEERKIYVTKNANEWYEHKGVKIEPLEFDLLLPLDAVNPKFLPKEAKV